MCDACGDSGLVAPDVFGDWVPWSKYVADVREKEIANDWPRMASAERVGMLRPMACPVCLPGREYLGPVVVVRSDPPAVAPAPPPVVVEAEPPPRPRARPRSSARRDAGGGFLFDREALSFP